MIPKVKTWVVTNPQTREKIEIDTINKRMVKIIVGMDYPRFWRTGYTISLKKGCKLS